MQLVSRKVLFDVMSHKHPVKFVDHKLNEVEQSSSAFRSFMTSANRIYNEMHGQMNGFNAEMF